MVMYRRQRVPGGTFFFTVTLANRRSRLLTEHIDGLREAFHHVRQRRPFETVAVVVLPEHLHAVWRLPAGDADYPGRWRAIKSRFTQWVGKREVPIPRTRSGAYRLWQPRYWEHTVRDEADLHHHLDYIHYNPVKHGLVGRVQDWPHSSFHRFVRVGWLDRDWGGGSLDEGGRDYGE